MLNDIQITQIKRLLVAVLAVAGFVFAPASFAQSNESTLTNTFVKIIKSDTSRFPFVELDFAIVDKSGILKTPITVDQLGIVENSVEVPADFLSLDYLNDVDVSLSIVLDATTDEDDLADMKLMAKELIGHLTDTDQVEVLSIGNGVEIIAELGDPNDVVFESIDNIEGIERDLNFVLDGVAEAIWSLEEAPDQKRTVFLLTNREFEEGVISLSTLARSSRVANTTVYVFGLGDNETLESLSGISRATGGATYINTGVDGLVSQAVTLLATLRNAYRLSYVSSHSLPNDLTLEVTHTVSDGTVTGSTAAPVVSTKIGLGLPVVPEDGVSGLFKFVTQSNGEAPIEEVQIYIDDVQQETLYNAPFVYEVNTTLFGLGDHTFTAIARDTAGNYGRIDTPITFVQTPVTSARFSQSRYELGPNQAQELALEFDGEQQIETVAFFINDEFLQRFDSPPYSTQLTTEMLAQGEYELTAVIVDRLGRETRTHSRIEHITSVFQQRTVQLTLAGGAMALTALLSLLAINAILKRQKNIVQKPFVLDIANRSNVKSRYVVSVEDVASALRIKTQLNGQTLPQVSTELLSKQPRTATTAPVAQRPPAPTASQVAEPAVAEKEQANLAEKRERAMGANKAFGQVMGSVARLLPKRIGAPLKQLAAASREVSNLDRNAQRTTAQVNKLRGATPAAKTQQREQRVAPRPTAPARTSSSASVTAAAHAWQDYADWLVTPELMPGEAISLTLHMSRRKRVKDDQYGVRVVSIPLTKAPSLDKRKVSSFKAMIPSVPLSVRLLPIIVTLVAFLLFLVAFRYFVYVL